VTTTRTETAASRPSSPRRAGGIGRFIRECVSEMRKVLWPTRKELVTYTTVVLVFVVVMVALVAGLDAGFAKLVLAVFG
jgi:preprotein translocase subunit SecE